ncbi:MAG: helix-turn-helix protein [Pseudomonadota bacterium]
MSRKPNDIDREIGRLLRQIRETKFISREQAGDVLDVSHQQISKIERGASKISASQFFMLCYFYQVSPVQIYQKLPHDTTLELVKEDNPHAYRKQHLLEESLKAEIDALSERGKQHLLEFLKTLNPRL